MSWPEHPAAPIQRLVLRGRQPVAALWFPADWFGEGERIRRIVQAWRAGSSVIRFPDGDILRYPAAMDQCCEQLPGWPLRREGAALSSAPLSEAERLALPPADVWLVLGASVRPLRWADGVPLDVSRWLAPGPALLETYDCRAALAPPTVVAPEARPLRAVLGDAVPLPSEQREAFMAAMKQRPSASDNPVSQRPANQPGEWKPPRRFRPAGWVLAAVVLFMGWLIAPAADGQASSGWPIDALVILGIALGLALVLALRRAPAQWTVAPEAPAPTPSRTTSPQAGPEIAPRRPRSRVLPQRWRQWLARLAVTSQVSRVLGRQQAAFLRHMIERFEQGDLQEALRHAIPLGQEGETLGQAFGTPTRRADLALGGNDGPGPTIHLGDSLEQHLRRIYRQSFERLDREGRVDEAVFVLAELLRVRQEALDYLEKKGRLPQAAELALAWDQPPDVIVRLLCLAGDWKRAIAVARRDGAFANAVLQLEKRWPDAARRLREAWGEALAQKGEWLAGVEAVWPLESARERAIEWLRAAEAAGGPLGARALVLRSQLLPDTLSEYSERLAALRDDEARVEERAALVDALLAIQQLTPAGRGLAAAVSPAVLADQARGQGRFGKRELQQLVARTGDSLLQADLPVSAAWPTVEPAPISLRREPLTLGVPLPGAHVLRDVVPLDGGRCLVAFGEAGAAIVDSTGRIGVRFAVPADRLVLGNSGQLALALARRDTLWRVSRLDLARRHAHDLGMVDADHFAEVFDGIGWTIACGNRLQVLDTGRSLQDVLWQVPDLPGPVRALSSSADHEHVVVQTGTSTMELWRYHLPLRRLGMREPLVPAVAKPVAPRTLHPDRGLVAIDVQQTEEGACALAWQVGEGQGSLSGRLVLADDEAEDLQVVAHRDFLLIQGGTAARSLRLVHLPSGRVVAVALWPEDGRVQARAVGQHWQCFDDRGRLLVIDTETSAVRSITIR